MRDTRIARRTLLASAAGYGICAWVVGPAEARRHAPGPRQPRPKPRVVALDPGHGGVDPGAISPNGLYEKTVTLATARELAHRLDASGRYRALLTRGRDAFVPLRQRVVRARASGA